MKTKKNWLESYQKSVHERKKEIFTERNHFPFSLEWGWEWETEPDVKYFKYKDFMCVILKHRYFLHFCGYVHSHKRVSKSDVCEFNVHGGLNFRKKGNLFPSPDLPPYSKWWYGFDCGHCYDLSPGGTIDADQTYRNFEFVQNEIKKLCDQLEIYKIDKKGAINEC